DRGGDRPRGALPAHAVALLPQARGGGESAGERGGPAPARPARGAVRRGDGRRRGDQVEGAVRDDGVGHGSLRGRGQRDRGHHPQDVLNQPAPLGWAGLSCWSASSSWSRLPSTTSTGFTLLMTPPPP